MNMKSVGYLAVFFGGLVFGYLAFVMGWVDVLDGLPSHTDEPILSLPTYLSFLSVMLTAVTVVLAALAIGVGIVAAYTIGDITKRANDTVKDAATQATTAAEKAVSEALSEDKINARLDNIVNKKQTPTIAELEDNFYPQDSGER
jgi:cytochrome bd-type quinol oxidase subunit 2